MKKFSYKLKRKKAIPIKAIVIIMIIIILIIGISYSLLNEQLNIVGTVDGSLNGSFGNAVTSGESSWTVTDSGWYAIQAWGGNGGASGACQLAVTGSLMGLESHTATVDAVYPNNGGYISGYVYLNQNQVISYSIGTAGVDGESTSRDGKTLGTMYYVGTAGKAGNPTNIKIDGTTVMIAGGGRRSWWNRAAYFS